MEYFKFRCGEALTLFIEGLSLETTIGDIESWLSSYDCNYDLDYGEGDGTARVFIEPHNVGMSLQRTSQFIRGQKIKVRTIIGGNEIARFNLEKQRRRIFVNGLPSDIKENDLRKSLGSIGELRSLYTVKGNINGKTLCYAEFVHKNHAKKAIKQGIFCKKKKYRVYKYRTLEHLQKNFEQRQDLAISRSLISQNNDEFIKKVGAASFDTIHSTKKERLLDQQEFSGKEEQEIKFHFLKPSNQAYYKRGEKASPTNDNPLFRVVQPPNKMTIYKKFEVSGAFVYIRLRELKLSSPSKSEGNDPIPGLSMFFTKGKILDNNPTKR